MGGGRSGRPVRVTLTVFGCLALVLALATSAFAAEAPKYQESFGPDGTSSTGFSRAGAIAVDQQGHFAYVIDHKAGAGEGSLLKFDLEGHPVDFGGSAPYISGNQIHGLSFFAGNGEAQVAVDSSGDNIYVTSGNAVKAFEASGEPYEFTAGPGSGTSEIGGFTELLGVAVDANGNIYAADYAGAVKVYAPSGEQINQFTASSAANLAVDSNGVVYVNRWHGTVAKFTPSGFPVTATTTYTEAAQPVDPLASYSVGVDPATNDLYIAQDITHPGIAWYDESGTLLATFAGPGQDGEVLVSEGIAVTGEGQKRRVFVANAPSSGLSQVELFFEKIYEGVPKIDSISAADVTANSATLRARINPGSAETMYHFEYGFVDCSVGPCTSVPISEQDIGNGHKGVPVAQTITGLQPSTTYHFRVVAHNAFGDNASQDRVFITQGEGLAFRLSDSRVWEMVSPPDKHGAQLIGTALGQIQAAADGEGIAYLSQGSIESDPDGNRTLEPSSVLARRTPTGWVSKDITPPNSRVVPLAAGQQGEYRLFNSDLATALLEPYSGTPLSPMASERTPYLRNNTEPPEYTPLVTGKEGFANVPPGTEFGGTAPIPTVRIQGASSDLTHVLLRSEVPLVAGAPEAPLPSLYEWTAGDLHPVSVLPASEGGAIVTAHLFGSGAGTLDHAVSNNGSRVFWAPGSYGTTGNTLTALYMRDTKAEETVRLDVVQPGASGAGEAHPAFMGANEEGTVVYFTDSQQLTEDSSANGRDLYRCEIPAGLSSAGCSTLSDISAPQVVGESAEVQGLSSGVSEDADTIYFVAKGVLDDGPNERGQSAVSGEPNLYIWQQGSAVRFIATLDEEDAADWGGPFGAKFGLSAASSPNGRYLSFMSQRSLTGYDNHEVSSNELVEEVFRYDAVAEQLDCVSCNPTSAAPSGQLGEFAKPRRIVDPVSQWEGRWVAALLPDPTLIETAGASIYRPRVVLDNGRVFFNSFDSLVPADGNGEWDVYQYESIGTGDCSSSSSTAATARVARGCVSLLSSGTANRETGFLDSSTSGDDVFFITPAQLSVMDEDGERDVYDARVNGVTAVRPVVSECTGEGCQQVSSPPGDSMPASALFQGAENIGKPSRHCRKGRVRARRHGKTVCVRRHVHKRHHHGGRRQGGGHR